MQEAVGADEFADAAADYEAEERWATEEGDDELPFLGGSSSEDEDDDAYYFILSRPAPGGDLWQASRKGDVDRIRYLLSTDEGKEKINTRDRWDSVPLYYACLAGHEEVAELLLEGGAICNEYTFDGDRCHYASLNVGIRALLRRYEARPPPLSPLAADLRSMCSLCVNPEATDAPRLSHSDFAFHFRGKCIPLHRAILAARSPYFRRMLLSTWQPQGDSIREVHLGSAFLEPAVLHALLIYMYSERLDISMDSARLMERVAAKCKCRELQRAIKNELHTMRYYFKSTRRGELAPRRFVLQSGALPPEAQLPAQLGNLRLWAAQQEAEGNLCPAADFADVLLLVDGRHFRCHKVVLSCRSEYFTALLQQSEDVLPSGQGPGSQLPVLELHDVSADVFDVVLTFLYTAAIPRLGQRHLSSAAIERLFDAADFFMLFSLKRAVAEAVLDNIEAGMRAGAVPGLEHLLRLLLAADTHNVASLRSSCLAAIAQRFDALASGAASERDVQVFLAFIQAVAPKDAEDIFDGSHIPGASGGNIEGGGLGGLGVGTVLQDMREAYLESHGGVGKERETVADRFDARLEQLAAGSLAAELRSS